MTKKILVFSPFQAITPHTFIETKIAELLKEHDKAEISAITCDQDLFSICNTMRSIGLSGASSVEDRKRACASCKIYRDDLKNAHIFSKVTDIKDLISTEIKQVLAGEEKKIQEQLSQYQFKGINLGRICAYEIILSHKLRSLENLTSDLTNELIEEIKNGLLIFLTMEEYLKNNSIDCIIFYNGNYSLNNVVSSLCNKFFEKVKPISIHYGFNWDKPRDKLYITARTHYEHVLNRQSFFKSLGDKFDISTNTEREIEINNYLEYIFSAKSVFTYSKPKQNKNFIDPITKLGLDKNKPTALLAMASSDEVYALQFSVLQIPSITDGKGIFKSQKEWIEKTIQFFKTRPDLQLIIRIHPREFPNKREKVLSQSALDYNQLVSNLPENIKVNVPANSISIYDLFDVINLHLTSWSTVGLESSLLGIPTISCYDGVGLYPSSSVHYYSDNEHDYCNLIGSILNEAKLVKMQKSQKQIDRARGWLKFEFNEALLVYSTNNYWASKKHLLKKVINKFLFPIAVYNYNQFSKKFTISKTEREHLLDYFKTFNDFHVIKFPKK